MGSQEAFPDFTDQEVEAFEMLRYGLDPSSEEDRKTWERETPPHGTPAITELTPEEEYRDDAFEFGSSQTP